MFDFAIIGSGVSGGKIAQDLTLGGAKCLLIEAGKEYQANTFPKHELDYSSQMFWGGGLEISTDGKIGFLRARCLGGTSVVNQALLDRFDRLAFDEWKKISGISFFTEKEMAPYYKAIESSLAISPIPERFYNKNAKLFISAFDQLGYQWSPLKRAQTDCKWEKGSDCIVCLGGCPRNSKQSALVTTIKKARENGLHIETGFEVDQLIHTHDKVLILGTQNGTRKQFTVAKIVLAAGSIGNSSILLRSGFGKKLPWIGKNFCCHPQFMTYAFFEELIDAHKGPFQAVKSDDVKLRRSGYKFENVFAPPIGTAMLLPGFGKNHLLNMKSYRYMASMEVAIRDSSKGSITLDKNGDIKIQKKLTPSDWKKAKEGLLLVKEFFESVKAKKIIPCMQKFGLHLMGGCAIGTNPEHSVVNPNFQVHHHSNIFIADSSIFPSAPGINPSLTIMALSHKAAQKILDEKF